MDDRPRQPEIFEGSPQEPLSPRAVQTFWIVGAILLVGLAILYVMTRLPDGHPYKECEGIIFMDQACKADIAAEHLMNGGI